MISRTESEVHHDTIRRSRIADPRFKHLSMPGPRERRQTHARTRAFSGRYSLREERESYRRRSMRLWRLVAPSTFVAAPCPVALNFFFFLSLCSHVGRAQREATGTATLLLATGSQCIRCSTLCVGAGARTSPAGERSLTAAAAQRHF
jgi:hypothetical protein